MIRVNENSYAAHTMLKHFRLKTGRKNASWVLQIMNRLRKSQNPVQMPSVSTFAFSSSLKRHNDTSKKGQLCSTHYFKAGQIKNRKKNASRVIQITNRLRKSQNVQGTNAKCVVCILKQSETPQWYEKMRTVENISAAHTILKHFRLKPEEKTYHES